MSKLPEKFIMNKVEKFTDLKQILSYGAEKHSEKNYFTYKDKTSKNILHVTFGQMKTIVDKLGTAFFKMNLMGGSIALLSETRYEWMATYFAAVTGNGVIIPLDREVAPEQLIKFIERADTDCIVYSQEFENFIESYAEKMRDDQSEKKHVKYFINLDYSPEKAKEIRDSKNISVYSFAEVTEIGEKALSEDCGDFIDVKIDNQKMCACIFTSGTTGTSKAVMLSHKNIAITAYNSSCDVDFNTGDVIVSVLPAHHTYETTCTFLATFPLGVEVCINESLKTVMRSFQTYKPTRLVLVPLFVETMAKKVWDEIEKKGKTQTVKNAVKLSNALRKVGIDMRRKFFKDILSAFGGNLTGIICGGAPLNPSHIKTFDDFGISVWQGYGITECSPLISVNPSNMHMKKMNSVGYPIEANTVKTEQIEANGYGEILVKGDNVMLGYLNDEEATKAVMTDDGYFRTGDIGYIDSDGYLYITGRKKNVIILSNGKNIYPEEIEEYLSKISAVKECVVVGRAAPQGGEVLLTAIIHPDFEKFTGSDGAVTPLKDIEAEIKKSVTQMNKELPTFKHINNVELRETEFDKTTSKKIIRYKVK